jgi:hypothetical protein
VTGVGGGRHPGPGAPEQLAGLEDAAVGVAVIAAMVAAASPEGAGDTEYWTAEQGGCDRNGARAPAAIDHA